MSAANNEQMRERPPTVVEQPMTPYGGDFARWAQEQAAAIAAGRWADVDAANVAEEIDALGISQRTEIRSRLRVLMAHLLKTEHQRKRATSSWRGIIVEQAISIDEVGFGFGFVFDKCGGQRCLERRRRHRNAWDFVSSDRNRTR